MNDRRLIKVDVDAIIAEARKKKEREDKCNYHIGADGEVRAWLRDSVNYCHECGKRLREIEE